MDLFAGLLRHARRRCGISRICVLLVVLSCMMLTQLVLFIAYKSYKEGGWILEINTRSKANNNVVYDATKQETPRPARKKLVLFYSTFYGRRNWHDITNENFMNGCEGQTNCGISYDKKDLEMSDAVMFYMPDVPRRNHGLQELSKSTKNRTSQRWVFFIQETPMASERLTSMEGVFNWTMTYQVNSDIFLPYALYLPYNKETEKGSKLIVEKSYFTKNKTGFVAWLVSNCGSQTRNAMVRKLMQYIPVHVYGGCSGKFGQSRDGGGRRNDAKRYEIIAKYKFYLAFENCDCVDYITEKYWRNSLLTGAIPVVFGGGNYKDKRLAIPGSYINVFDFPSVKDLATYLMRLNKNDTAYDEYLSWRQHYFIGYYTRNRWPCRLCAMLHNSSLPAKSYDDGRLHGYFARKTYCDVNADKIKQLLLS